MGEDKQFNLIVSTYALREESAIMELTEYVGRVYVLKKQRSLLILRVPHMDPYEVVERVRELVDPFYTNILRVIPVDAVTSTVLQEVASRVWELYPTKIGEDETYRITMDGYLYWREPDGTLRRARTRESIDYIASHVKRKVNLTKPDKIIYIKTVNVRGRELASITICRPDQILSTQKMRLEAERRSKAPL